MQDSKICDKNFLEIRKKIETEIFLEVLFLSVLVYPHFVIISYVKLKLTWLAWPPSHS
jgi:hypothetical protein